MKTLQKKISQTAATKKAIQILIMGGLLMMLTGCVTWGNRFYLGHPLLEKNVALIHLNSSLKLLSIIMITKEGHRFLETSSFNDDLTISIAELLPGKYNLELYLDHKYLNKKSIIIETGHMSYALQVEAGHFYYLSHRSLSKDTWDVEVRDLVDEEEPLLRLRAKYFAGPRKPLEELN